MKYYAKNLVDYLENNVVKYKASWENNEVKNKVN
jgi:hypothetical protein